MAYILFFAVTAAIVYLRYKFGLAYARSLEQLSQPERDRVIRSALRRVC